MLDECGGPNVGPYMGTCGGLVTRDSRTGEIGYSGQYQAFSHIVPYITAKSKIYSVSVSDSFGQRVGKYPKYEHEIEGFVVDNQDSKKIAVLINPNGYNKQSQIKLGGKLWYMELQAKSISTILVER